MKILVEDPELRAFQIFLLFMLVVVVAIGGIATYNTFFRGTGSEITNSYEQGGCSCPCQQSIAEPQVEPERVRDDEHTEWTIRTIANAYGVDEEAAVRIAKCESQLNPSARNSQSSALGIYQFTDATWEFIGNPGDRTDVFEAAVAFAKWYPKYPQWWVCK